MDTQNIIMVELNAFLHYNVVKLANWYEYFGNEEKASHYGKIADDLFDAIQEVTYLHNYIPYPFLGYLIIKENHHH